jgi:phosphoserine phosphatase RsbU/P
MLALSGRLLQDHALTAFRLQVADIIVGSVFVFVGLAACGIAAMRHRSHMRILIWLGIWSAIYGVRPLFYSLAAVDLLPRWIEVSLPFISVVTGYLILVVGLLAWRELCLGKLRLFLEGAALIALVLAFAGIAIFLVTGASRTLMPYNNLVATCTSAVLVMVVAVPTLAREFLVTPNSKVLFIGMLAFALQALYTNVLGSLGHRAAPIWGTLGFAILLFSFGYAALEIVFANERRLVSIENELAIAREIQTSILPSGSPEIRQLHIAAVYHPMTAVAGDYYDFIPVDEHRVGVLVADVSGHGVPAALIAAMMKMAVQSIVPCAHSPRDVLQGLNRMLSGQASDQLVTAAYLFIDTQNCNATYSAAGHPPLLLSRAGRLQRIESNGLVFGVSREPEYPVRNIPIFPGDRLLLYTDGLIEPENAQGEAFGSSGLEDVILGAQNSTAPEVANTLLAEIRAWQPAWMTQQDDITLIVIDVG